MLEIMNSPSKKGGRLSAQSTLPQTLDAIADVVLAYRPKPKSKPAKKRKRRAAAIQKSRNK
jgi:hypothetical protein